MRGAQHRRRLRISLGNEQFIDIPLLAEIGGGSNSISITPVVEAGVGTVLMMKIGDFILTLAYDPVMASSALMAQDLVHMRTLVSNDLSTGAAVTLTVLFGGIIMASAIHCRRLVLVRVNFSKIIP